MKKTLISLWVSTFLLMGCSKPEEQKKTKIEKQVETNKVITQENYKSLDIDAQQFKLNFNKLMELIDEKNVIAEIDEKPKQSNDKYSAANFLVKTSLIKLSATVNDDNTLREILMLTPMPKTKSEETTVLTAMVAISEALQKSADGTSTVSSISSLVSDATSHPTKASDIKIGKYLYTVNYSPELNSIFFAVSDSSK